MRSLTRQFAASLSRPFRSSQRLWNSSKTNKSRIKTGKPPAFQVVRHFVHFLALPSDFDVNASCRTKIDTGAQRFTWNFPEAGLVRLSQFLAPAGPIPVSKSTWWQGVKTGRFPKPQKLALVPPCGASMASARALKTGTDVMASQASPRRVRRTLGGKRQSNLQRCVLAPGRSCILCCLFCPSLARRLRACDCLRCDRRRPAMPDLAGKFPATHFGMVS